MPMKKTKKKKRGFTTKYTAEITGIQPRIIQYYAEHDIVIPEVDSPEGSGTVRRYSRQNQVELLVVRVLADFFTVKTVAKIWSIVKASDEWARWVRMGGDYGNLEAAIKITIPKSSVGYSVEIIEGTTTDLGLVKSYRAVIVVNVAEHFHQVFDN